MSAAWLRCISVARRITDQGPVPGFAHVRRNAVDAKAAHDPLSRHHASRGQPSIPAVARARSGPVPEPGGAWPLRGPRGRLSDRLRYVYAAGRRRGARDSG
jgi:hypothetical protein